LNVLKYIILFSKSYPNLIQIQSNTISWIIMYWSWVKEKKSWWTL